MIIGSESLGLDLKAKMKLFQLECLLEEDTCRFQTQSLEFWQAKEILEMHMTLVHRQLKYQCDSCDRDTKNDTEPEIIEEEKKAISDELDEAICEILEHLEGKASSRCNGMHGY